MTTQGTKACMEQMANALRDSHAVLNDLVMPDLTRGAGEIYFAAMTADAKVRAALSRYEASK